MILGERQVEIPWLACVFEKFKSGLSCLDVGSAGADYLDILDKFELTRLDRLKIPSDDKSQIVQGDIRLFHGSFDIVTLVSSLEHVGLDAYGFDLDCDDPVLEQRRVFEHCYSILNPGGYLVATIPFGMYENGGWYIIYDSKMIDELLGDKFIIDEVYFTLDSESWAYHRVPRYKCPLKGQDWVRPDFSRATSICCLIVQKIDKETYSKKINLGCGGAYLDGFVNVDALPLSENVIKTDIFNYMKRCPSNSVDHIIMSHVIEHLPFNLIPEFLSECYRSLEKGGLLEIVCPDGDWYMNEYQHNRIDYDQLHLCFHASHLNEYDFHLWTPVSKIIKSLIDNAGFVGASFYTGDSNIGVHCQKG